MLEGRSNAPVLKGREHRVLTGRARCSTLEHRARPPSTTLRAVLDPRARCSRGRARCSRGRAPCSKTAVVKGPLEHCSSAHPFLQNRTNPADARLATGPSRAHEQHNLNAALGLVRFWRNNRKCSLSTVLEGRASLLIIKMPVLEDPRARCSTPSSTAT